MTAGPDITLLQRFPDLAELPDAVLQSLLDKGKRQILERGQILFAAGEPYAQRIFLLIDGRLELQRDFRETIAYAPGEFVGLSNYLDKTPYAATAVAADDCTLLTFAESDFARLEQVHPELAALVDRVIARRLRQRRDTSRTIAGVMGQPVSRYMTAPLAECDMRTTIREAHGIMQSRKIGSLAVFDEGRELIGMLTFAGLCDAWLLRGALPESPVAGAACEDPVTIDASAPLWLAEDRLQAEHVKYLVVLQDDEPVGLISQTDLFRARLQEMHSLTREIGEAQDTTALHHLYRSLPRMAAEAHERHRHASQAVQELSEMHLAIQRRCVQLTLDEMEAEHGPPPRNFALLVMGSGGRREMLLNPDQDNGLILDPADGEPGEAEKRWFGDFAVRLNDNLDRSGYVLCPGEIMARNPLFHKTLDRWQEQITHMTTFPNNKSARWANIVFDFTTLYGDERLTEALRRHLLDAIHERPALLGFMVEDDAEGRPPIGLFNQFLTSSDKAHQGQIDIKRNGLRLVADAARIYALHAGIAATGTRERLRRLVHQGILSRDLVDSVLEAFDELLDVLLRHQVEQAERGETPDKYIDPDALSWQSRSVLRVSFRAIKRLQDQLQGRFGREAF